MIHPNLVKNSESNNSFKPDVAVTSQQKNPQKEKEVEYFSLASSVLSSVLTLTGPIILAYTIAAHYNRPQNKQLYKEYSEKMEFWMMAGWILNFVVIVLPFFLTLITHSSNS